MAGNTLTYIKGSTFDYSGSILEDGNPLDLSLNLLTVLEVEGNGMNGLTVSVINGPAGTFRVTLADVQAAKLPPGRGANFKLVVTYVSGFKRAFPSVWVDVK